MINSKTQNYADQVFDQSLSRIRQRISGLTENRQLKTTSSNSDGNKLKYGGFTGRLDCLEKECKKIVDDIHEMNLQKRSIRSRLEYLRSEVTKNLQGSSNSPKLKVQQLGIIVRNSIEQSNLRQKQIEENYYRNLQASNKMKISLSEMRNQINQIQHRIGCNATIWQQI